MKRIYIFRRGGDVGKRTWNSTSFSSLYIGVLSNCESKLSSGLEPLRWLPVSLSSSIVCTAHHPSDGAEVVSGVRQPILHQLHDDPSNDDTIRLPKCIGAATYGSSGLDRCATWDNTDNSAPGILQKGRAALWKATCRRPFFCAFRCRYSCCSSSAHRFPG